jgi:hypothetical protein
MRYKSFPILCAAVLLACSSLASAAKLLENIALEWKPTSKVVLSATAPTPVGRKIQFGAFGDARADKSLIGKNREEERQGTVLPVSTVTDVPSWTAAQLKYVLRQNGIDVVDEGGELTLDGDVEQFFVDETDAYRANIGVHLRLRDAGGNILWETSINANESRFGRSYKKENYCEVLSDALINVAGGLLKNGEFRSTLALP